MAATGSPKHTPQVPNFPLLPENGKHINRMAGPYNSSKGRAGVEPVRSESREGDSQTVIVGMKGMQGIEAMLRSMLEAQEKLAHQVGELTQKVVGMDQKVEGMDQKVEGMERKVDQVPQMVQNMKELTGRVRCMDWQRLRWRRVEWERIPPDMRVMVIPFLGVQDIMSLNSAISGKRLRKQLKKSYRGAVIPAFDQHRFTEKGGFKGLRWVMKAEVCLQRCEMVVDVEEGFVIEDAGEVTIREKILESLMHRFEVYAPFKVQIAALDAAARRDPQLGIRLLDSLGQAMRALLRMVGDDLVGLRGEARVRGVAIVAMLVAREWQKDETADLAHTMKAIDTRLTQAEEWGRSLRVLGHGDDSPAAGGAAVDDGFATGGDGDLPPQDRYQ